ncbi:MAG TPA: hypothetical protein EYG18_11490 [Micavibrio sp.]|nr:hypothetical protein [Pseudomonadota bacterium]HIF26507.1 hypothetical protein [Micavibrio sp.]HIL29883.1 hypothetical protein [Micavibrio sp.]
MPNNHIHLNASHDRSSESGNVIFFILLAIVLVALITAAVRGTGEGGDIDNETLAIRVSEVREYTNEIERGLRFIMHDGASETEIRFAHPDAPAAYGTITNTPTRQVFSNSGGGVQYRTPDPAISSAANWEFYGSTHLPGVGTDDASLEEAELIAVLPDVTQAFCAKVNQINGYDEATQPIDTTGTCIYSGTSLRFSSSAGFAASGAADNVNDATFTIRPAMQGCVSCNASGTSDFHFFHVLMAR